MYLKLKPEKQYVFQRPHTATDGVKKQKLLLMLQECDEQEAAEILPAIEYLLALIHKRGSSND